MRFEAILRNALLLIVLVFVQGPAAWGANVAITIDDPHVRPSGPLSWQQRDEQIRAVLKKHGHKAALFVCGMRIDNADGKILLHDWERDGHLIGNHSYSHPFYHSKKVTFEQLSQETLKTQSLLVGLQNFVRLFRFPFLKEGNTAEKRDRMRSFLKANGYKPGYVSIDASDWYISQRLEDRLKKNPSADRSPYRDFLLKHIWERAAFYNDLSTKVLGREVLHTLLLHHNLLNGLFIDDLIKMLESKGWKVVDAAKAFRDPVYDSAPNVVPAGESILWALAKETGKFENILRYPGEDGDYEKAEMDKLGL